MNSRSDINASRDAKSLEGAAQVFVALADPTRLAIVAALEAGPQCVCDLARTVGISQSGVSHQLRALRDARIVDCTRQGRHAIYRITDPAVSDLLRTACDRGADR